MTIQILTADLHLTDDPKDEYRWGLFPWLAKQEWDELWILGDLTDKKDRHSAVLVNRFVNTLDNLGKKIYIVNGNHDGVNSKLPFFGFLNHLSTIHYHSSPIHRPGIPVILPFQPSIDKPWEQWPDGKLAVFHGTVTGAKAENGQLMSGVPPEAFKKYEKVWAGDIHVQQQIGNVEYVGAPYHIHFGDVFTPRLVRLTDWANPEDLHFEAETQKLLWLVESPDDLDGLEKLPAGTQVKVRISLPPHKAGLWHDLRTAVEKIVGERHLNLCGLELVTEKPESMQTLTTECFTGRAGKPDVEVVREFGELEKLPPDTIKVGGDLCENKLS